MLPVILKSQPRSALLFKEGIPLNAVNTFSVEVNDTKEAHDEESEFIILCDCSPSMDDVPSGSKTNFPKIVMAGLAISQFVGLCNDKVRLAIYGFADSASLIQRFVSTNFSNKINEIEPNINSIRTFGSTTKLAPALQKAFEQFGLSNNPSSRKAIIVLTDGEIFDKAHVLEILKKNAKLGIPVYFIGFGLTPAADNLLLDFANGSKEFAVSLSDDEEMAPYFLAILKNTSLAGIIDPVLFFRPVPFSTIKHVEFVQKTFAGQPENLYIVATERVSEPGVFELKLANMTIKHLYEFVVTMEVVLPKGTKEGVCEFAHVELQGKTSSSGQIESVRYPLRNILAKATGNPNASVVALQTYAEAERAKAEAVAQAAAGNFMAANEAMNEARKTVARATVQQQASMINGIKIVEKHLNAKDPKAAAQALNRQTQARPGGLNVNLLQNFMANNKK